MKASTGIFFSSDNCRMRRKIRCDCDGEPPGELIMIATARALRTEKARSSVLAVVASIRPGRSGDETPMTPDRRTTGTTGMAARNRGGNSQPSEPRTRDMKPGGKSDADAEGFDMASLNAARSPLVKGRQLTEP